MPTKPRNLSIASSGGRSARRAATRTSGQSGAPRWRLALWIVLPIGVFVLSMPVARPNKSNRGTVAHAAAAPVRVAAGPSILPGKADADGTARDRRGLTYYTEAVRDDMFSAPQPPVVVPKPVKVEVTPAVVLPDINPFEDWAYTGTIHSGSEITALLENTKTKEGNFVKVGDTVLGERVSSITDQMVTVGATGHPRMLAKTDTMNVTQLDKDAPANTAPAAGPRPGFGGGGGIPGMPNPAAAAAWMRGGQPITLGNGVQITPQMARRYMRQLNANFNN